MFHFPFLKKVYHGQVFDAFSGVGYHLCAGVNCLKLQFLNSGGLQNILFQYGGDDDEDDDDPLVVQKTMFFLFSYGHTLRTSESQRMGSLMWAVISPVTT
jgi:hypothetical protein